MAAPGWEGEGAVMEVWPLYNQGLEGKLKEAERSKGSGLGPLLRGSEWGSSGGRIKRMERTVKKTGQKGSPRPLGVKEVPCQGKLEGRRSEEG